ncbi:hypothetical protein F5882DRAFT_311323, partial [Hyaloscypha sp. PMI_1271]
RQNQIYYNEISFRNILGFFPMYIRPLYSEYDNNTQAILSNIGYHVIYYNINSSNYLNDDPSLIQLLKDIIDI